MASRPIYAFGSFRLDPDERQLVRQGRPVALAAKAFDTLVALVERPGRLVTKDELLRRVWPDAFVEENNLAQAISTLRRVLADGSSGEPLIETVPRRGYRFVCPVVVEPAEQASPAPGVPIEPMAPSPERGAEAQSTQGPARAPAPVLWSLAIGSLVVLLVAAWTVPWLPSASSTIPAASEGAREGAIRIAVLPFLNMGSADEGDFVAGLTEEITSRLARVVGLAVPSSTTIAAYDRSGKDLSRLGSDLRVEYVIEGAVRWAVPGESARVRITPRLVRVADDTTVWTEQYDALLPDLIAVQADIAEEVARSLQVTLDAGGRRSVAAGSTVHTDAYLAYLRGIAAYRLGVVDTANQLKAREELERAVTYDPRFALAWSRLGQVYAEQYQSGSLRSPETVSAAYRAVNAALTIEPDLAEAHMAMAAVLLVEGKHQRAREELNALRDGDLQTAEVWHQLAAISEQEGDWAGALDALRRAFDTDPVATADLIGIHYLNLRDYAEAARYIDIARAANRTGAVVPDAWRRFSDGGNIADARAVLEADLGARTPPDARAVGLLARLEWFDGRHRRALELIQTMDAAGAWISPSFRFPAAILAGQVHEDMGHVRDAEVQYKAAMTVLREREQAEPDNGYVLAAMALAASGLGRHDDARQHLERALALTPTFARRVTLYRYFLAQVHSRAGRLEAALATLDTLFAGPNVYNETWVRVDPWLAAVRTHPDFERRLAVWARLKGESVQGPRATVGQPPHTR